MVTTISPGRVWDFTPIGPIELAPGRVWERSQTPAARPPIEISRSDVLTARSPKWRRRLPWLAALGLLAGALTIPQLSSEPAVTHLEPHVDADALPLGSMYHVVDQVGARSLWEQGITGAGVGVAVIDTGVAPVESLSGPGKVTSVVDFTDEAADPSTQFVDTHGHGTHMAGVIAGREPGADPALSAEHPEWFLGVAPDASIVSVKVGTGSGNTELADVITGIDWVIDHAAELDIRIISLSFSSGSPLSYQDDPLTAATERAWAAGLVVVTPAGNDGPTSNGLTSPANDPYSIAVAGAKAFDDTIEIADWSNAGDGVRNPDVAAPGAHIDSLRAPGSDADVNHPEGFIDDETFRSSGSSPAAAVVAGAAALLLSADPSLTPDQVKAKLATSAQPIADTSERLAGSGLIDVSRAADATTGGAVQTWPRATSDEIVPRSAGISSTWAGASWAGASWAGASWAGASWAGASWAGASWAGASWAGASWAGASWAGASWAGASWAGASWAGASWAGASWAGASWAGASWAGASWAGASWAGASWAGASWAGASWAGASWAGASWA